MAWFKSHGQATSSQYPYTGKEGKCKNINGQVKTKQVVKVNGKSSSQMKAALEKINNSQELQQAMARLYQEQAGAAGAEGAGPQAGPAPEPETAGATVDDNVVDAEVEDVDESK